MSNVKYKHIGKELKFIKDCAVRLNLDWKSIAARPVQATILVNCFEAGATKEVAIMAYSAFTNHNETVEFNLDLS